MTKEISNDDKVALLSEDIRAACGDRYRIDSILGAGAFGEVYKALDTLLNRTVALKKIRADFFANGSQTEELRLRFLREAQVAAQLQHPNIVTIYDIVSSPELNLIVMELIEGTTLGDKLKSEVSLPLSETVRILSQVAEALDHAHLQKVVHRDVKPANVLLSHKGLVKVTDFGTAKADTSTDLTVAGNILGTPDYMSPEQARGEELDGRSDLFSLGCVLYQCLTGEKPFRSSNVTGILLRIVSDDPTPINSDKVVLDSSIDALLRRALAKDREERFQSGAEFRQALEEVLSAETTRPPSPKESTSPPETVSTTPSETPKPDNETQDSVADVLMREARNSEEIETFLFAMKRDSRCLAANTSSMLEFRNVILTPEEAYILSRVDGRVTPADIFSVSPLSETDSARALLGFLRTGLISFVEASATERKQRQKTDEPSQRKEVKEGSKVDKSEGSGEPIRRKVEKGPALDKTEDPEDPIRREVEELLALSRNQDDREVLGVASNANLAEIKRAFHKKVFRFHPDRHSSIKDEAFQRNLSQLFTRLSDAFAALTNLSKAETTTDTETKGHRSDRPSRAASRPEEKLPPNWNDPQQANGLFQAAQAAYQREDYFRTIEYCQKAIEIDQSKAEYFYLLGKALSENPKWTHDAEKNLRMATELDPSRPEYLAALGGLYRSEGLSSRARRTFDKLKALDPSYPIPTGA